MECAKQGQWRRAWKDCKYGDADTNFVKRQYHQARRRHDKKLISKQLEEYDKRFHDWLPEEVYEKGYYKGYQEYKPYLYADYTHVEHNHKQKLKEAA